MGIGNVENSGSRLSFLKRMILVVIRFLSLSLSHPCLVGLANGGCSFLLRDFGSTWLTHTNNIIEKSVTRGWNSD